MIVEVFNLKNYVRYLCNCCLIGGAEGAWGPEQGGPGGPWPIQYSSWVGHNAFGPPKNVMQLTMNYYATQSFLLI
jgi:hypothetical protein